ncbi:ATP-binding SpoIIE family protein phosphatase [Aliidiomarina haloalkalitolerans]|uniref:Response regulatory domain-containing protein n=1 Tax=Aliidiomarina haloalkalitolerans TaxID=859059 RepID=A0A432VXL8_9GAMM|nr:SpoIIE family protein phosphatase [Aliidiomarina haloalkalitolerans]RUO21424.1 hypothetical protein CWE06_00740 [Aliidiomarina haloalkalitolerans]
MLAQILLVQCDERPNEALLEKLQQSLQYELHTYHLEHAFDALERVEPDLVLFNFALTRDTDFSFLSSLKQSTSPLYLPFIVIANAFDEVVQQNALYAGADDFLVPPFSSALLFAKLETHLRTRHLSQRLIEKKENLAWYQERLRHEHLIVRNMFNNALSRNLQDCQQVETLLLPLSSFNGDLYLLAKGPLGSIYLLLGDFTGHGLPAAIGTLPTSQTFFAMAKRGAPIGQIAHEINQQLHKLLPENMFLCATLMELSASGNRVSWWSGGMPPALVIDADDSISQELTPQHLPLGILPPQDFEAGITMTRLEEGARVMLFTDGVIEMGIGQGKPLDYEDFYQICQQSRWNMAEIKQRLALEVMQRGINDDLSVMLLHCVPTGYAPRSTEEKLPSLPFEIRVHLTPNDIRHVDPVAQLLRGLSQLEGFPHFKARLYTALSEAYNNALDHGLLRLSSELKDTPDGFEQYYEERNRRLSSLHSGAIDITLSYQPPHRYLRVAVKDTGPGFAAQTQFTQRSTYSFGRGLLLIKELANNIRWFDQGRGIEFDFPLFDDEQVAPTNHQPVLP